MEEQQARIFFFRPSNELHRLIFVEGLKVLDFDKMRLFFHDDDTGEYIEEMQPYVDEYMEISKKFADILDNVCLVKYGHNFKDLFHSEMEKLEYIDTTLENGKQMAYNVGTKITDRVVSHFRRNGQYAFAQKLKDHKGKMFYVAIKQQEGELNGNIS